MSRVPGSRGWHPVGAQEMGEEAGPTPHLYAPTVSQIPEACLDGVPQPGFSGYVTCWCRPEC